MPNDRNVRAVSMAFENLLREIRQAVGRARLLAQDTGEAGNYIEAKRIMILSRRYGRMEVQVATLYDEWNRINKARKSRKESVAIESRKNAKRLKRGERTPEELFIIPILRALSDIGGSGKVKVILLKVKRIMVHTLRHVDLVRPHNSNRRRYEISACWTRSRMVKEGLLKSGSPRGIWEITDDGIAYLKAHSPK